jgi:flagellin
MSDGIVLSAGVRANLLSLQQTADLLTQTQERLSTGKKVNTALDNPIAYFTAQSLTRRSSSLSDLLDQISNGVQTLQAANNGITSLTKLVQNAQSLAQQARLSVPTTAIYSGTASGLTAGSAFTATAGDTITINDGTTTATFTLAASGNTVQQLLNTINNTAGLKVKAELSAAGQVQLEATSTNTIVIGGTATVGELGSFGLVAGTTAAGTLNATRTSLAGQYDALLTQIDQLAADSGFNGVNLLNGNSLKVIYNDSGTSYQLVNGVKATSAGLGIAASTNSFQTDTDVANALTNLGNALTTLATDAATFGANLSVIQTRQDFTKATINTLTTGAANLTLADTNEEGANLLALQTRQSLATTSLSLATQSDRNVLKLFGG